MSYQFYSKERTADDIIVEIAQLELKLSTLRSQALNEDAASQNPRLAKDIKDTEAKLSASQRALAAANKLKDKDKAGSHRSNITGQQAKMQKKLNMMKGEADKVDKGSHIGKGEVAKKKDDADAKKSTEKKTVKDNADRSKSKADKVAGRDDRKAAKENMSKIKSKRAEKESKQQMTTPKSNSVAKKSDKVEPKSKGGPKVVQGTHKNTDDKPHKGSGDAPENAGGKPDFDGANKAAAKERVSKLKEKRKGKLKAAAGKIKDKVGSFIKSKK